MKSFCCLLLAIGAFVNHATAGPALQDIPFQTMEGKASSLREYANKVVLVVNVASRCGNTPQYAALEELYQTYQAKGFVVLGFPCNDFGGQEPGTNAEIKEFCSSKYHVTFPILDKIHVKGAEQHPLYAALTAASSPFPGPVKWNFGKFLIGKDGKAVARFEPGTKPADPKVIAAIQAALK